jgi:nucleoside-diphosphate-sugar epimerase
MRVLVTGAAGFVAKALVPLLCGRGHTVRLAVRRPIAPVEPTGSIDVVVTGDIGRGVRWDRALDGVDAVVHLAARVHVPNDETGSGATFRRINVDGTRALAAAAARAGVHRFVYLSSIKAVADRSDKAPIDDNTVPAPETPYGRSKRDAEAALAEIAAGGTMSAVALRPPLVYGPGVKGNFLALMNLCWRRWPVPLGGVCNRRSLLYVGNLADAIERVISAKRRVEGAFALHDGQSVSTPDLVVAIGRALGRRGPLLPVPVAALRFAAGAFGRRATFDRLTESLEIDDRRFRAAFDWQPPYGRDEGLAETALWYRSLSRPPRHP